MIFRTLKGRSEGPAPQRPPQTRASGYYASFGYVAAPDPGVESLSVVVREGPAIIGELIPPIREGIEQGRLALGECGEWFCSVKVEIITILRSNTAPGAFTWLAKHFAQTTLRDACEPLLSLDPSWRTPDVLALARHAHETRDHAALPVLADALEEAGCDLALLLDHCRSGCDHGGWCWAVQLALAGVG